MLLINVLVFNTPKIMAQNCGEERWSVKTLSDPDTIDINFNYIVPSTIGEQIKIINIPNSQTGKRSRYEDTLYSLNCLIIAFKKENDKDIHIVLKDINTNETMVGELISDECDEVKNTSRYNLFVELNKWFRENIGHPTSKLKHPKEPIPVKITGVSFYDFLHGQKGMASNGREIHPILSMSLIKN